MAIELLKPQPPDFPATDWGSLEDGAAKEHQYGDAAIGVASDFVREVFGIIGHSQTDTGRDAGILRGLAVRSIKLFDRLVDASVSGQGEIEVIFARLMMSTNVTLDFLVLKDDKTWFDSFAAKGFKTARQRKRFIERNTLARGSELDIETRQLRHIADEASLAGHELDEPRAFRPPPWPSEKTLVTATYGAEMYSMYGLGSDAVHGGFKDLISRHVDPDDEWSPILDWKSSNGPAFVISELILASRVHERYGDSVRAAHRIPAVAKDASRLFVAWNQFDDRRRGRA